MISDNQKDNLITKLLRGTLRNSLKWCVLEAPHSLTYATENYIPRYFEADFNGTRIGIYEYRYRYYTEHDEFHWSDSLGICIVHNPDIVVWKIEEYSPNLRDLFQVATEQASGLSRFFNS